MRADENGSADGYSPSGEPHAIPWLEPDRSGPACRAVDWASGDLAELQLPVDLEAPLLARCAAVEFLGERVAGELLDRVRLVVSELATNSLLHSSASEDDRLVLRIGLSGVMVCIELQDPGRGGRVAARIPDLNGRGGFGLHLVDAMSARWGVEYPGGETCVWAQILAAA